MITRKQISLLLFLLFLLSGWFIAYAVVTTQAQPDFIVDTETERNSSWPEGSIIFCKDSNKTFILNGGTFYSLSPSTVGGTGTVTRIPKWSTPSTKLTDSLIRDNGTNVGIGNLYPNKLGIYSTGGQAGIYFNDAIPGNTANTLYNSGGSLFWENTNLMSAKSKWTEVSSGGNIYRMYGNVGIGVTNPNAVLQVNGAISRQGTTLIGTTSSATHVNLGVSSTTGRSGFECSYITISGGLNNTAEEDYSTIRGGTSNTVVNLYDMIGGGYGNFIRESDGGGCSVILGGQNNLVGDDYAVIEGGQDNYISDMVSDYSVILGGQSNQIYGTASTILGGSGNIINYNGFAYGDYSAIGGGTSNTIDADYSVIMGGKNNIVDGEWGTIMGGQYNNIGVGTTGSVIGGGTSNTVLSNYSVITGGENNIIQSGGDYSVLTGGLNNEVSGQYSVISGGRNNTVSGNYSAIPGGSYNTVAGDYSIAMGSNMGLGSNADRSFVFGYSDSGVFNSNTADAFLIDPNNYNSGAIKVGIGTSSPSVKLDVEQSNVNRYIARIYNTTNNTNSDGLSISIGQASGIPVADNKFILFQNNGTGTIGSIEGNGIGGVIFNTVGADYAEYFKSEQVIEPGYLAGLNALTGKVRKWQIGDYLIGVVSTAPGFAGNKSLNQTDKDVLVALVGQFDLKETDVIEENRVIKTRDNQKIGFRLANGKVFKPRCF